jgi:DnaK suppressor protein
MASPHAPLTKAQLETLRRSLEDQRARIQRVLRTPPTAAPAADEPVELEEGAQVATERAQQQRVADRERALLAEVERALAKLDRGSFGLSETTGEPIPYERLLAMPWARSGVDE